MDPERFRDSPTGRLMKVGRGDAVYWAFMPHPLPPDLALAPGLVRILSEADRALGELAGLGRAMPNPHLLIAPLLRREAVLSSRIEGTQADIADLYAYEAGQPALPGLGPPPSETDVREVSNYVRALEYGLERVETLPVSLRLIRELHGYLMERVRGAHATPGEFRTRQNWIGPPESTLNTARFVPPPVPEMREALGAFERYLHRGNDHPPLVRLAFIHYQFEAIHPFVDGNGRIGRLLLSLLLINWGLIPLPLLYLSAYFERHRQDYYDLLLTVSERGAWPEWLAFFLRGVAEQSRDTVVRAKRLQDLREEWRQRLTQVRASALPLQLADSLFGSPIITIPQAQRILGVKQYRSAKLNVEKLVEADVLQSWGDASYGKTFIAGEILNVIEESQVQDG